MSESSYKSAEKRQLALKKGAGSAIAAPSLSNSDLLSSLGPSKAMPGGVREKMERSFGMPMSDVKLFESPVVSDHGAAAAASGKSIAFAPGKLDFSSASGQTLLGHELSHVASQARGEVTGHGYLKNPSLEHRADVEGARAASGETLYSAGGLRPMSTDNGLTSAPMQAKESKDEKEHREEKEDILYDYNSRNDSEKVDMLLEMARIVQGDNSYAISSAYIDTYNELVKGLTPEMYDVILEKEADFAPQLLEYQKKMTAEHAGQALTTTGDGKTVSQEQADSDLGTFYTLQSEVGDKFSAFSGLLAKAGMASSDLSAGKRISDMGLDLVSRRPEAGAATNIVAEGYEQFNYTLGSKYAGAEKAMDKQRGARSKAGLKDWKRRRKLLRAEQKEAANYQEEKERSSKKADKKEADFFEWSFNADTDEKKINMLLVLSACKLNGSKLLGQELQDRLPKLIAQITPEMAKMMVLNEAEFSSSILSEREDKRNAGAGMGTTKKEDGTVVSQAEADMARADFEVVHSSKSASKHLLFSWILNEAAKSNPALGPAIAQAKEEAGKENPDYLEADKTIASFESNAYAAGLKKSDMAPVLQDRYGAILSDFDESPWREKTKTEKQEDENEKLFYDNIMKDYNQRDDNGKVDLLIDLQQISVHNDNLLYRNFSSWFEKLAGSMTPNMIELALKKLVELSPQLVAYQAKMLRAQAGRYAPTANSKGVMRTQEKTDQLTASFFTQQSIPGSKYSSICMLITTAGRSTSNSKMFSAALKSGRQKYLDTDTLFRDVHGIMDVGQDVFSDVMGEQEMDTVRDSRTANRQNTYARLLQNSQWLPKKKR